jgi:hypothetical protein
LLIVDLAGTETAVLDDAEVGKILAVLAAVDAAQNRGGPEGQSPASKPGTWGTLPSLQTRAMKPEDFYTKTTTGAENHLQLPKIGKRTLLCAV